MLAVRTGIPPSVLWAEDPRDLATMVDLLEREAAQVGGD